MKRACGAVSLVALFSAGVALPAPAPAPSGAPSRVVAGPPAQSISRGEVVRRADDPKLDSQAHLQALRAVLALDPAPRDAGLRYLVGHADEDISATAARQLIYDRARGAVPLISRQVGRWGALGNTVALESATDVLAVGGDPALRDIARAILRRSLGKSRGSDSLPAGLAALVLTEGRSRADERLLHHAVRRFPRSRGAWLALSDGAPLTPAEKKTALATYSDPGAPELLRAAAAVALSRSDPAAAAFAKAEIAAAMDRFSSQDLSGLLMAAQSPGGDSTHTVQDYQATLRLLAMCRFMTEADAGPILEGGLGAANFPIKLLSALALADAYPNRLLAKGPDALPASSRDLVLAFLCARHPDLRARVLVSDSVPAPELAEASARLERTGVFAAFFPVGSIECGL